MTCTIPARPKFRSPLARPLRHRVISQLFPVKIRLFFRIVHILILIPMTSTYYNIDLMVQRAGFRPPGVHCALSRHFEVRMA